MNKLLLITCAVGVLFSAMADDVAVFPVQGVNAPKSFTDAFGVLLASKYEKASGLSVINTLKSARAIGADSNLNEAAKSLGVNEYLEVTAVGLYVSNSEKKELMKDNGVMVNVINGDVDDDDDDDDEDDDDISSSDQKLLDNSKTIVTVCRRSRDGALIHKVEMTLLTYGDIEESTARIALALFKKISVEEAITPETITRREGMGKNKTTVGRVKGIRLAMACPISVNTNSKFSPFMTIMYDYRFDMKNFFVEWAAGARIPAQPFDESIRSYGGVNLEIGGSYYLVNNFVGAYIGGGINPFFDFVFNIADGGIELGIAPFMKFGIMFPQASKVRTYFDFKVAQNVIPITTGNSYSSYDYSTSSNSGLPKRKNYPTEIGLDIGIAW